jgi:hypothetical protein
MIFKVLLDQILSNFYTRNLKSHYFLREKCNNSEMENVKYTVIELNRETKKKEGLIEKSEKKRKRRGY